MKQPDRHAQVILTSLCKDLWKKNDVGHNKAAFPLNSTGSLDSHIFVKVSAFIQRGTDLPDKTAKADFRQMLVQCSITATCNIAEAVKVANFLFTKCLFYQDSSC